MTWIIGLSSLFGSMIICLGCSINIGWGNCWLFNVFSCGFSISLGFTIDLYWYISSGFSIIEIWLSIDSIGMSLPFSSESCLFISLGPSSIIGWGRITGWGWGWDWIGFCSLTGSFIIFLLSSSGIWFWEFWYILSWIINFSLSFGFIIVFDEINSVGFSIIWGFSFWLFPSLSFSISFGLSSSAPLLIIFCFGFSGSCFFSVFFIFSPFSGSIIFSFSLSSLKLFILLFFPLTFPSITLGFSFWLGLLEFLFLRISIGFSEISGFSPNTICSNPLNFSSSSSLSISLSPSYSTSSI